MIFFGGFMEEFILFLMAYVLIFLFYQVFVVKKAKKGKKNDPVEVLYLMRVYRLDRKKVDYPQLLQIIAITSSFDIALVVSIISFFKPFLWKLLSGVASTVLLILVSYHIVYLFYKKKGMIKDV